MGGWVSRRRRDRDENEGGGKVCSATCHIKSGQLHHISFADVVARRHNKVVPCEPAGVSTTLKLSSESHDGEEDLSIPLISCNSLICKGWKLIRNANPTIFTLKDLVDLTDDFSEKKFIGKTQFCKVYRWKIPQGWKGMAEQCVTVKIWADKLHMRTDQNFPKVVAKNVDRFIEEIGFLTGDLALNCPYLGKLKGFCSEQMGVVYDLNPIDTLRNLITGGTLKWVDRIRILYQFAVLLEHLHVQQPEYLVRNISAAHIMINQDLEPVLFEFGMLARGQFHDDRLPYPCGAFGYMDMTIGYAGVWSCKVDVFAFRVLVLELLCRVEVDMPRLPKKCMDFLDRYAEDICAKEKSDSFVSKRFPADPTFDAEDTLALLDLAPKCVNLDDEWPRPSMSEIVKLLESLNVFSNTWNGE